MQNTFTKYLYSIFPCILVLLLFSCQKDKEKNNSDNKSKQKPNIIIFLADDLGYGDLNCYGGIPGTPNIDQLAKNGLKFTNFYAPAPNCSPSRAGLLTGRNPNRVGIYTYRRGGHSMHLKDKEITIAELLQKKGYESAFFGKWHLSNLNSGKKPDQPLPSDQGFDHWMGNINADYTENKEPVWQIRHEKGVDTIKGYSCQILTDLAKKWLKNRKDKNKPFFLYLPFHEVHKKIAAPDSLEKKYKGKKDPLYQATVENMDKAVGEMMDYLRSSNQFENTLIVYSSDNGSYRHGSNGNTRGYKGESFEGGVRVPGIFHWPAKIKQHKTITTNAGLIDMLPTICDITKTPKPEDRKLDGISLYPVINNKEITRKKPLFWFFYRASPESGMRDGKYLLNGYTNDSFPRTHHFTNKDMEFIKNLDFRHFKLYNLEKDPKQKHDISGEKTELLDSLVKKHQKIFSDIQKDGPDWKNLPEYQKENANPKREYMRNQDIRPDWNNQEK